jgi:hypothetical protein
MSSGTPPERERGARGILDVLGFGRKGSEPTQRLISGPVETQVVGSRVDSGSVDPSGEDAQSERATTSSGRSESRPPEGNPIGALFQAEGAYLRTTDFQEMIDALAATKKLLTVAVDEFHESIMEGEAGFFSDVNLKTLGQSAQTKWIELKKSVTALGKEVEQSWVKDPKERVVKQKELIYNELGRMRQVSEIPFSYVGKSGSEIFAPTLILSLFLWNGVSNFMKDSTAPKSAQVFGSLTAEQAVYLSQDRTQWKALKATVLSSKKGIEKWLGRLPLLALGEFMPPYNVIEAAKKRLIDRVAFDSAKSFLSIRAETLTALKRMASDASTLDTLMTVMKAADATVFDALKKVVIKIVDDWSAIVVMRDVNGELVAEVMAGNLEDFISKARVISVQHGENRYRKDAESVLQLETMEERPLVNVVEAASLPPGNKSLPMMLITASQIQLQGSLSETSVSGVVQSGVALHMNDAQAVEVGLDFIDKNILSRKADLVDMVASRANANRK